MKVSSISDLIPVSINEMDGYSVATYLRKNNKGDLNGDLVSITFKHHEIPGDKDGQDETFNFYDNTSNIVEDEVDRMTTYPEFKDIAPKAVKTAEPQVIYNSNTK